MVDTSLGILLLKKKIKKNGKYSTSQKDETIKVNVFHTYANKKEKKKKKKKKKKRRKTSQNPFEFLLDLNLSPKVHKFSI
jgi:protease II